MFVYKMTINLIFRQKIKLVNEITITFTEMLLPYMVVIVLPIIIRNNSSKIMSHYKLYIDK